MKFFEFLVIIYGLFKLVEILTKVDEKTLKEIEDAKNKALNDYNEKREKEERIRLAKIAEQERKDKEYEEWKIANPKLGFIYVLKNDMAKGHVKIGFTNGETSKRIKEINSGTCVIGKWSLIKHWHVDDARDCEKRIHRKFSRERTQKDREFFEIEEESVVLMMQEFMDKRGYYVDRKYWKDGECKTIYSDLDIQTLKDNFNARVLPESIKPLDLNHQFLTNQSSDHKKTLLSQYIIDEETRVEIIYYIMLKKGNHQIRVGIMGVPIFFRVCDTVDLCAFYNKSSEEINKNLEIIHYKGEQDREKKGEVIYQINYPTKPSTWIVELRDSASGGASVRYNQILRKITVDKYECWKPNQYESYLDDIERIKQNDLAKKEELIHINKKIYADSYISLLFEDGVYSDIEVFDYQFASDLGSYFNKSPEEIIKNLDGKILKKNILIDWENKREEGTMNFF